MTTRKSSTSPPVSVIELSVGGVRHCALRTTLCTAPGLLRRMFDTESLYAAGTVANAERTSDGLVFIDRDGVAFEAVLAYLRTGVARVPEASTRDTVQRELEYFFDEPPTAYTRGMLAAEANWCVRSFATILVDAIGKKWNTATIANWSVDLFSKRVQVTADDRQISMFLTPHGGGRTFDEGFKGTLSVAPAHLVYALAAVNASEYSTDDVQHLLDAELSVGYRCFVHRYDVKSEFFLGPTGGKFACVHVVVERTNQ